MTDPPPVYGDIADEFLWHDLVGKGCNEITFQPFYYFEGSDDRFTTERLQDAWAIENSDPEKTKEMIDDFVKGSGLEDPLPKAKRFTQLLFEVVRKDLESMGSSNFLSDALDGYVGYTERQKVKALAVQWYTAKYWDGNNCRM